MARVLIVDDSAVMRRNLRVILEKGGHEVVGEANNGKQALLLFEQSHPDIVTMDITMPMMDGLDATKRILAKYPASNIIVISALDQKKMVLQAIEYGVKNYILKPFTEQKVLEAIAAVLNPPAS